MSVSELLSLDELLFLDAAKAESATLIASKPAIAITTMRMSVSPFMDFDLSEISWRDDEGPLLTLCA